MSPEKPNFAKPDFEKIIWKDLAWKESPHKGVFICKIFEEKDPENSSVPKRTFIAVKVAPGASIPLHKHKRAESNWREKMSFEKGSQFEILKFNDKDSRRVIVGNNPYTITVHSRQFIGIRNTKTSKDLFFLSDMKPGYTGPEEIERFTNR